MKNWKLYDEILNQLGGEEFCLALCEAMDADNMNDILEFIATCYEIELN